MVFNRRSEPVPPEVRPPQSQPQLRRPEPPVPVRPNAGYTAPNMAGPMMGHNTTGIDQSVIGSDLSIEGQSITIRCKGTLRINGNIQADLHSRGLEVGPDAIISGSITADTVEVHGRVNGAINGQKVTLHTNSEVEGDIHSQSLSIEHGAAFDGRSRRVTNVAEITPQLDSPAATMNAASRHSSTPGQPTGHTAVPQSSLDRLNGVFTSTE